MADLVIIAGNVILAPGRNRILKSVFNGEPANAVAAGEFVYEDANHNFKRAHNGSLDPSQAKGMALNSAAPGQTYDILEEGFVFTGSALQGIPYYLSNVHGKIQLESDIIDFKRVVFCGAGNAGNVLAVKILASGAVRQP